MRVDAREWIERANFLMKQAKKNLEGGAYWFVCFEVHQAVEFYLKALSLSLVGIHPYTHDLVELLEFLREADLDTPEELYPLADALTPTIPFPDIPGDLPSHTIGRRRRGAYGEKIISWVREATED